MPAADRVEEIASWLRTVNQLAELRALNLPRARAKSAYFRLPEQAEEMARQALAWEAEGAKGVYWAFNPIKPDMDRAHASARDADVAGRQWILVDIDPVRPADTCSTDLEKGLAWALAEDVRGGLASQGWGYPVTADSGNGYHLLYPVDLPNDETGKARVQEFLRGLDRVLSTDQVHIDTSVFNAARIVRLWGTLTRKGKDLPGRPWRRSRLLHVPEELDRQRNNNALKRILDLWARREEMRTGRPTRGEQAGSGEASTAVGDDFDRRATWEEVLEPHGWKRVGSQDDKVLWARPGKAEGHSATTGHCHGADGGDLLHVFSGNASPFESNKSYGKFRAYALLNHGGNHADAAKALAGRGYGDPQKPRKKEQVKEEPEEQPEKLPETLLDVARLEDLIKAGASIEWLWPDWIARRVITIVAADGGVGKTRFTMDLMRRVTLGLPWPDGKLMTADRASRWLWVLADDNHAEAADMVRGWKTEDAFYLPATKADPFAGTQLDGQHDRLRHYLRLVRPTFLVVDTLGSATSLKMHSQEECELLMRPLRKIAQEFDLAILCLTHLNSQGGVLGRRVVEKARQVIMMSTPDPDGQPDRRRLWVSKSNAKKPPHLGVTMHDGGCDYDDSPPCEPGEEPGKSRGKGRPPERLQEATEWLKNWLADGKQPVGNTRSEAEKAGFNAKLLYRVVEALGVEEIRAQGRKWWSLATGEEEVFEG